MSAALARLRRHLAMPLLWKELLQLAGRRRTYVVRCLFVGLLGGVFGWLYAERLGRLPVSAVLGYGGELLDHVVWFAFGGVYLVLPAMAGSALTAEKERGTLPLLLLTPLGPARLVGEKLLGRLLPMLVLLGGALPVLGLCYSLGGVEAGEVVLAAVLLLVAVLQVGAVGLCWSVLARSTAAAFVGTGVTLFLLYFGIPILMGLGLIPVDQQWRDWIGFSIRLCPAFLYGQMREDGLALGEGGAWGYIAWELGIAAAFLLAARLSLTRVRQGVARSGVLRALRRLDTGVEWLNRHLGNVVLVPDRQDLPGARPVYWRETRRRGFGRLRYVVRILLLLELPVLAYVALYVFPHWHEPDPRGGLQAMAHLWWLIAALSVVLVAVHTIAAERSRLNLETLLTTPLSGRRILQEKARGLAPLLGALAVPYLTLVVVSALHSTENPPTYGDDLEALFGAWHGLGYAVLALLTAAVYLPLLGWLGLLIGSKVRSLTRGVLVAIFGVAGWCALPILGLVLLEAAGIVDIFREGIKAQALVLSPASMVLSMEMGRFPTPEGAPSWAFIILNSAWHLGLLFAVRWWSLRWADVRLGRAVTAGAERVPAETGKAQT